MITLSLPFSYVFEIDKTINKFVSKQSGEINSYHSDGCEPTWYIIQNIQDLSNRVIIRRLTIMPYYTGNQLPDLFITVDLYGHSWSFDRQGMYWAKYHNTPERHERGKWVKLYDPDPKSIQVVKKELTDVIDGVWNLVTDQMINEIKDRLILMRNDNAGN